MNQFSSEKRDHLVTAGSVSNLRPEFKTKQNLVNKFLKNLNNNSVMSLTLMLKKASFFLFDILFCFVFV